MATVSRHSFLRLRSIVTPRLKMLAVLAASWTAVAWAGSVSLQAAVVNGPMTTTTDAPLAYDATGTLTTSEAWTDNSPPAVEGPWYEIPAMAPAPADGLGAYWKFSVRHSAMQFKSGQATKARLWVKGQHLRVPLVNHGEGLNNLAEIGTEAVDVTTTGIKNVAVWGGQPHALHRDRYGVVGTKMSYSVEGATATLGGKVDVIARHSESVPDEFKNWKKTVTGFASVSAMSNPLGSMVSFDALTNMLSLRPGRVDVLDLQGGLSQSVDPQFATDALLGAQMSVSPLRLLGVEPDGRFRFSGGMVNVGSPTGNVHLQASFDEYLIGDTSQQQVFDSFADLSRGVSSESVHGEMPTFLERFNADHVLQQQSANDAVEDRIMSLVVRHAAGTEPRAIDQRIYAERDVHPGRYRRRRHGAHSPWCILISLVTITMTDWSTCSITRCGGPNSIACMAPLMAMAAALPTQPTT